MAENNGDDCVQDLILRKVKKIVLVSWTDNKDINWIEQFHPVKVVYDSEEDDPNHHERIKEIVSTSNSKTIIGLPKYAQNVPTDCLIKLNCKGCNSGRWARLNKAYPGKTALREAEMGEYIATCLNCGYENEDNYNWYER